MEAEELNTFRVNPSILDLKDLRQLTIELHACDGTNVVSTRLNNILTVVSGYGAFRIQNLKVDLDIGVCSRLDSKLYPEVRKSLESLTPFLNEIKVGTGVTRSQPVVNKFHVLNYENMLELDSDGESDDSDGSLPPLSV